MQHLGLAFFMSIVINYDYILQYNSNSLVIKGEPVFFTGTFRLDVAFPEFDSTGKSFFWILNWKGVHSIPGRLILRIGIGHMLGSPKHWLLCRSQTGLHFVKCTYTPVN